MKKNKCIDAGREGCPCMLAEYGRCLVCSKLNGGTCEDCSWQGICIGSLYRQNGRKTINHRKEQLLPVRQVRNYSRDFKVFIVEADRGFCQKAQTAGAYVFVRGEDCGKWYDAPISVLKAEPEAGLLHLGICRCGIKSDSIFLQADKTQNLWVRGVYYNALSGMSNLKENVKGTLVYAKGIALAPFRNFLDGGYRYTKWLRDMRIFVDLDKVGFDFFMDYFGDLPAECVEVHNFAEEGIGRIESAEACNVFALTSPYYAQQLAQEAGGRTVHPTEGNMCCGEGVCGACTYTDELGCTVRRCKVKD